MATKLQKPASLKHLAIQEQRMFLLKDYALKNDLAANDGDYWDRIKFPRNSISDLRKGKFGFTVTQIIAACKLTGASADWLFDLDKTMFRTDRKRSAIEHLKQAVAEVEFEMNNKQ